MSKRWGYVVVLVGVVSFILWVYNEFNGNPISKYVAKKQLETYIEETYPEKEMVIVDSHFDFKMKGYTFLANVVGTEDQASFNVHPFFNKHINDEYEYQFIDEEKTALLEEEAEEELTAYVKKNVPQVKSVFAYLKVKKGESIVFSKEVMASQNPQIEIVIDSTNQSGEEFLRTTKRVKKVLDEGGFVYSYANVNGKKLDGAAIKEGEVLYGTGFEPEDKEIILTSSKELDEKEGRMWDIQKYVMATFIVCIGLVAIYFLVRGFRVRK